MKKYININIFKIIAFFDYVINSLFFLFAPVYLLFP